MVDPVSGESHQLSFVEYGDGDQYVVWVETALPWIVAYVDIARADVTFEVLDQISKVIYHRDDVDSDGLSRCRWPASPPAG